MIGEVCVAMESRRHAEEHRPPPATLTHTMSEAIREAAKGVDGWTMQS